MQSQPQRVVIWSPLPLSIIKSEDCAQNLFRWPFHPRHIFVKDRIPGIRGLWGLELTCLVLQRQKKKRSSPMYYCHLLTPSSCMRTESVLVFMARPSALHNSITLIWQEGSKDTDYCLHVVWSGKNTSLGLVFTSGNDQIRLLHIMGLILRSSSEI